LNFWSSERNEIYFDCRVVTKVSEAKIETLKIKHKLKHSTFKTKTT